uniref:Uncharacterized protein n=1 Tax=Arundo donax TaxID=35708 RepID=A0A0A9A6N0_ARUDO
MTQYTCPEPPWPMRFSSVSSWGMAALSKSRAWKGVICCQSSRLSFILICRGADVAYSYEAAIDDLRNSLPRW